MHVAALLERELVKKLGELRDLFVRHAAVRFADVDQLIAGPDGETAIMRAFGCRLEPLSRPLGIVPIALGDERAGMDQLPLLPRRRERPVGA